MGPGTGTDVEGADEGVDFFPLCSLLALPGVRDTGVLFLFLFFFSSISRHAIIYSFTQQIFTETQPCQVLGYNRPCPWRTHRPVRDDNEIHVINTRQAPTVC